MIAQAFELMSPTGHPVWPRCPCCQGRKDVTTDFGTIVPDIDKCQCTSSTDFVNHPPHYTVGPIECIDAIRAALTEEEFRGYCKGNALKYVWRERHKGGEESLRKAEWYLKRISQCPPPPSPAK